MIEKYALFKVFKGLRESSQKESVRSLAKKSKVSVASAKRCLDYLFEKKIIKREILGKLHQLAFDNSSILTRQLKIAFSIAEICESSIIEELTNNYQDIFSITLFGSIAQGKDTPNSDIDILIISRKEIKLRPLAGEKNLNRELSIIKYTLSEWRRKSRSDAVFYQRVIIDGISLYGELPVMQ